MAFLLQKYGKKGEMIEFTPSSVTKLRALVFPAVSELEHDDLETMQTLFQKYL
jgi:hypothetical protein